LVPIPNSYWVRDGLLLAGEYPGNWNQEKARKKIAAIVGAGITSLVDLSSPQNGLLPYDGLLRDYASEHEVILDYSHHPIRDMHVPKPEVMRAILDVLDERVAAGRPTYLHCKGGIGRTGTVVGCYLVRHGLSGEDALAQVARLFATMEKAARHPEGSPQTDKQRLMVYGWARHDVQT
jgi:protein-tyrosine phosphatase